MFLNIGKYLPITLNQEFLFLDKIIMFQMHIDKVGSHS